MIRIKNPCVANWQEMRPHSHGKFCSSCEKVVVDFSKMSDTEIVNYFTTATKKTCGRFATSQVDRKLRVSSKSYFTTFFRKLTGVGVVQSAVFLMASSFLWLSSCVKKQITLGEPQYNDPDYNNRLMGDTVLFEYIDTSASLQPEHAVQHLQGEVVPYEEMIVGKIRINTINQRIKRKKK